MKPDDNYLMLAKCHKVLMVKLLYFVPALFSPFNEASERHLRLNIINILTE